MSTSPVVIDCAVNGTVAECFIEQEIALAGTTITTRFPAYTQNLTLVATTLYPLSVANAVNDSSAIRSVYTQLGNPPLPTPASTVASVSSATQSSETAVATSASDSSSAPMSVTSDSDSSALTAGPPPTAETA